MKKKLLIFLILFFGTIVNAQLDKEHWFAPMFDRNSANNYYSNNSRQYLYLSTNETTPFRVEVYNNNVLIASETISKGDPKSLYIDRKFIISKDNIELGKSNKGLYIKGDKSFFANLKISTFNHAEILTSKGLGGIGNKFYAVVTPIMNNSNVLNFTFGVLATEDNTKVTISGYKNDVKFSGMPSTPSSIEVVLNKGESYLLDGIGTQNKDGFIGAKIESTKPVSVTNGNFNGNYIGSGSYMHDIILDQSVPVDRLGKEFVIIKGSNSLSNNIEGGIIVATKDNTHIFVNDELSPIATLNEGQYFIIPENRFVNKDKNHYNLYIKSTENIYLYQFLAGEKSRTATLGFNYVPPISCYLPNQIGEIGLIDEMQGEMSRGHYNKVPTKLNIIAQKGALIKVEGLKLTAENGPFDVTGMPDLVTYSVPNVSGNINISSTKPILAGINAGNEDVGYGGYFIGFSSAVVIKKTGECIPETILETDREYDTYQWKKDGVNIAGANSKTYTPTEPGNYSVEVSGGSCGAPQVSSEIEVLKCPYQSVRNIDLCNDNTEHLVFSTNVNNNETTTIKIQNQPNKGQTKINPEQNKVHYIANSGSSGEDTFTLEYCATPAGGYPTCEIVKVNINLQHFELHNAKLTTCENNGKGIFDLTKADVGDITTANYQLEYYKTLADAQNRTNKITNPKTYESAKSKVYVLAHSQEACQGIIEIDLDFHQKPAVDITKYNATHCDADFDGNIEVDFSKISATITDNTNSVKYYLNEADAQAGANNHLPNNWTYSSDTEVFVRVSSGQSCAVVEKITFKVKDRIPLDATSKTVSICDKDTDAKVRVNLADYLNQFTSNTNAKATYYQSLADAKLSKNPISSQREITNGEIFFIRIEDANSCASIAELKFDVKIPLAKTTLKSCSTNGAGVFDLTTANIGNINNYPLKYYPTALDRTNGTNEITNPQAHSSAGGVVYVKADTDRVCTDTGEIVLELHPTPEIDILKYNATHCDINFDGKVEVDFSQITSEITSGNVIAQYYLSENDAQNNVNPLPNQWTYTADTDVFVKVKSNDTSCASEIKKISFKIKDTLNLSSSSQNITLCDKDLDGIVEVNLADYHHLFTSEAVRGTYYASLSDAQNMRNALSNIKVNDGQTYYLRLEGNNPCANIATITFKVNIPQHSTTLHDLQICNGSSTVLDAGTGFTAYQWSTGETTQSITAGVGEYWVDLHSSNACFYRQYVKVSAIVLPQISSIDIKDNVAKINVIGGTAPYLYSLDGGSWQSSNVFTNVSEGRHIISVRSQNGCEPVSQDFVNLRLVNVITPNGDGLNDVIDYSGLMTKANVKLHIYDRYGALVFEGNRANRFIWDGKAKGRPLPTATYWYLIEWQEPNTDTWVKKASWILLENRK